MVFRAVACGTEYVSNHPVVASTMELDFSGRSLDFISFDGKIGLEENLDDFLSFFENFFCCVFPYDDVIDVLQVKVNCGLYFVAKGMEKNVLVTSIVAYHFAVLDSSSYWSSNMSGTVAFNGGVTSFKLR
ncbi:hypothetical protein BTVI_00879 [Pitangus sulphuratus]|nr:hypothetical protein BTVI_00879 [Pitangus sulphuratus]